MRFVAGWIGVLVGSLVLACAAEAPVVSGASAPVPAARAASQAIAGPVAAPTASTIAAPVAGATADAIVAPVAGATADAIAAPVAGAAAEPFDAATATRVRAKIVAIPNRKQWVPCGDLHSVGALEVEVQDVGEPAPRMILFVSCPVDGRGPALVVGATLVFKLHARKQPWPGVRGLPDLPRRYVAGFGDAGAGGTL